MCGVLPFGGTERAVKILATSERKTIVVTGATGLEGGAVARHLLEDGHVRGLTRDMESKRARALKALGADVVQSDIGDVATLRPIFEEAFGIYRVQNPFIGGPEAEASQGKNIAEAAKEVGVRHLVYGSAGNGKEGTDVPSWETKLQTEDHIRALGLPLTVLRPMAFMELMTHKKFFPAVDAWHLKPKLMDGRAVLAGVHGRPRRDRRESVRRYSLVCREGSDARR